MGKIKAEMRRIHWPSRKEMAGHLKVVLSGMIFLGLYITALDFGFKVLVEKIISLLS